MTRSRPRRRIILVVDDELDVLLPLSELLEQLMPNVRVYAAQSADEALSFLAQNKVDLVITDLRMPGLDGEHLLGVLNALRKRPASILMTGFPDPGAMFRCLNERQVGAIVTKPFDAVVMADTASRLLEEKAGGVAA